MSRVFFTKCKIYLDFSTKRVYNSGKGSDDVAQFGKVLKSLRKDRGISQIELSKALGLSFSTISMYEREERSPDFETLEAIADYFNVSMDYLLGFNKSLNSSNIESHVAFPTGNEIHLIRKAGTQKKYTLSDKQMDVIEAMLEQMHIVVDKILDVQAEDVHAVFHGEIAAEGGGINARRRKPETTIPNTPTSGSIVAYGGELNRSRKKKPRTTL